MKKIVLATAAVAISAMVFAQTKPVAKPAAKPAVKPAAKPAAKPALVLKNGLDSLSYALGVLDGGFFKQQGLDKLNYNALQEGFRAVIEGKELLMTPDVAEQTLRQNCRRIQKKKFNQQLMKD